jgi:hypothetical protein
MATDQAVSDSPDFASSTFNAFQNKTPSHHNWNFGVEFE